MKPLPFLISIPHGGTDVPPEVEDLTKIGPEAMREDVDHFTREVFALDGGRVSRCLETHIARTFVDLNRDPSLLPPQQKDGVVKTHTCLDEEIYARHPDQSTVELLMERYYWPYHRRLQEELHHPGLVMAFDCHSMAGVGPALSPDPGRKRPLVCLGNRRGQSAPDGWLEMLAASFREVLELPPEEVSLNTPYPGGYISRFYGQKPLPMIQIELSRALYVEPEHRFDHWREQWWSVLQVFWERLAPEVRS